MYDDCIYAKGCPDCTESKGVLYCGSKKAIEKFKTNIISQFKECPKGYDEQNTQEIHGASYEGKA